MALDVSRAPVDRVMNSVTRASATTNYDHIVGASFHTIDLTSIFLMSDAAITTADPSTGVQCEELTHMVWRLSCLELIFPSCFLHSALCFC